MKKHLTIRYKKELNGEKKKHNRFCSTEGKLQSLFHRSSCKMCVLSTLCTCPAQPFVSVMTHALSFPFSLAPRYSPFLFIPTGHALSIDWMAPGTCVLLCPGKHLCTAFGAEGRGFERLFFSMHKGHFSFLFSFTPFAVSSLLVCCFRPGL